MKRIILISALILSSFGLMAQTSVKQNSDGNYTSISQAKSEDKETGKTFTTAKGEVFKVYKSVKGKLYIIRKSKKTGTEYNQYLKLD